MHRVLKIRYWRLTGNSLVMVWRSVGQALRQLARHQAETTRRHIDAAQARLEVASQAGDVPTLVRDQIDLLPESRRRVSGNWRDSRAIVESLLRELAHIWADYRQRLRETDKDLPHARKY